VTTPPRHTIALLLSATVELPSSDGMDIDMMPSSETSSHVPASSATELSSEEVKADDLVLPDRVSTVSNSVDAGMVC
jgi:hypothetical protein